MRTNTPLVAGYPPPFPFCGVGFGAPLLVVRRLRSGIISISFLQVFFSLFACLYYWWVLRMPHGCFQEEW